MQTDRPRRFGFSPLGQEPLRKLGTGKLRRYRVRSPAQRFLCNTLQETGAPPMNGMPGPALVPGVWFEYEIVVQGDDYSVFLSDLQTGVRQQTTSFRNTDGERGRAPGFVGVQAYAGNTVVWRHIRIKP